MRNIILSYNIILTIILTIGLAGYYVVYRKTNQKGNLFVSLLFFVFMLDNSTVFLSEFSNNFYLLYESSNLFYIFLDLSYLAILLILRIITSSFLKLKIQMVEKILICIITIAIIVINLLGIQHISEFLLFCLFYAAVIGLAVMAYRQMKPTKKNQIMLTAFISICLLGIAECIYSNFVLENNILLNLKDLDYRYISFEVLKLFISIIGIKHLLDAFNNLFDDVNSEDKLRIFSQKYELTIRQKEIVQLIIDGCSNKEIGERLHITEGTVKTHIYNIFKKTDVASRNQIINKIIQSK